MNISSLYNGILSNHNQINNNSNTTSETSFKDIINNEIEKLNNQHIKADGLTEGFISGQIEDLHTVMIATDEARLSLELAVQVRNKCVEAYKEINNMQL